MATNTGTRIAVWDFTLKQGADWSPTLTWLDDNGNPMNLTGYLMVLTIRAFVGSPVALLTLSSANTSGSRIELGGTAGTFELIFAGADTALLNGIPIPFGGFLSNGLGIQKLGVYDLKFVPPNGLVGYLFEGAVSLDPRSTV